MEKNATRKSETQLRRVAEVGRANRGGKKTITITTVIYNYVAISILVGIGGFFLKLESKYEKKE